MQIPILQVRAVFNFGGRTTELVIQDDTDSTALQAACSYANVEIVKLLLESGADPNIEGTYLVQFFGEAAAYTATIRR